MAQILSMCVILPILNAQCGAGYPCCSSAHLLICSSAHLLICSSQIAAKAIRVLRPVPAMPKILSMCMILPILNVPDISNKSKKRVGGGAK